MSFILNYLLIALEVYQWLILIYVFSSWFGGLPKNAFGDGIRDIIKPIMTLVQKIPHKLGPLDLAPIYAFILIGILKAGVILIFTNFSI